MKEDILVDLLKDGKFKTSRKNREYEYMGIPGMV